jgi:hypothetical protein
MFKKKNESDPSRAMARFKNPSRKDGNGSKIHRERMATIHKYIKKDTFHFFMPFSSIKASKTLPTSGKHNDISKKRFYEM